MIRDLPDAGELAATARRLGERRAPGTPAERAAALGRVHGVLLREERTEALATHLAEKTGFAEGLLRDHLRGLFGTMDAAALAGWLRRLNPEGEGPCPGPPPAPALLVASGNIPGAALPSLVQLLLLGCPTVVRVSRGEPWLTEAYGEALAAEAPELASLMETVSFPGDDAARRRALAGACPTRVVYGSDAAVTAWREPAPEPRRFLGYGHRISLAAVARECRDDAAAAAGLAVDVAAFDQQGCLSPQAVLLESEGVEADDQWCRKLAAALEERAAVWPRRPLEAAEHAAIHQYRARAEMDPESEVWMGSHGTDWTVVRRGSPAWRGSPLLRCVEVLPVARLEALDEVVGPLQCRLLCLSLAASPGRAAALTQAAYQAGFTRVCRPGEAQFPRRPAWHDGVFAPAVLAVWRDEE